MKLNKQKDIKKNVSYRSSAGRAVAAACNTSALFVRSPGLSLSAAEPKAWPGCQTTKEQAAEIKKIRY